MHLNNGSIDVLTPQEADFFVWDDELRGFGIRVWPSGQKTFVAQYRKAGRVRRLKIGRYGPLKAEDARKLAKAALGDVAHGEDPAAAVQAENRAPTLAAVIDRFLKVHGKHLKPASLDSYTRVLNVHVRPRLGTRKIGDVSRADIAELHEDMDETPYQANRTLAALSKLFNLAEVWEYRADGSNPCKKIRRYAEHEKQRFLTPEELQRLAAVLATHKNQSVANAIRLLILTGCRKSEILKLKWDDIGGEHITIWESKTGKRLVAMTDEIRAILLAIPRSNSNPHVIVGECFDAEGNGTHYDNLNNAWRRIRTKAKLEGVRIHDLRHTYASHTLAGGESLASIRELLGHKQIKTTMRYVHLMDENVRRSAAKASAHMGALLALPVESTPAPDEPSAAPSSPAPNALPSPPSNVLAFPADARAAVPVSDTPAAERTR
jgi:integrase